MEQWHATNSLSEFMVIFIFICDLLIFWLIKIKIQNKKEKQNTRVHGMNVGSN